MRFVAIKSTEQQSVLALHRTRDLLVGQRTQLVNMIRSQLAEYGIVLAKGIHHALRLVDKIVDGVIVEYAKRIAAQGRVIGGADDLLVKILDDPNERANARLMALQEIRGLFFLDLGAAYFDNDSWIDPQTGSVRVDEMGQQIDFDFFDSENDRLQDLRGSYGVGFQFRFLGGLQFNWVFAKRLPYTEFVFDPTTMTVVPQKADTGGTDTQFYIAFDF